MKALVIKSTGSWYTVEAKGGLLYECRIKGRFRLDNIKSTNPIVVGDFVEIKKEEDSWMIIKLFERKNQIVRKSVNLSKQTHIIASNIDQAFLIVTLAFPETTTGFIDRFLVSANAFGVEVILLFNKNDLYESNTLLKQDKIINIYEKIGYECYLISALNDDLNNIQKKLKGKNTLISGHSGVGKSTLINKLLKSNKIPTQEISLTHKQGQHTTTFSELYRIDFGTTIIDTPGIKGFGLVDLDENKIDKYFPEFLLYKKECKFHNCIHKNEPNCNIKKKIKDDEIAESRYKNYLTMLEEDEENYRQNNY
jgi:ribosome biogenesis GTPase / thiamine phosphate phosphatase